MLENLDRPNVKDLILEFPARQPRIYNPPFYNDYWAQMQEALDNAREDPIDSAVEYFDLSTAMVILKPSQKGSIEVLENSLENMSDAIKQSGLGKVLFNIAVVKGALLYPEITRQRLQLEGLELKVIVAVEAGLNRPFQSDDLAAAYICTKRLFPDRITLSERLLKNFTVCIADEKVKGDWFRFSRLMASLKIAFPETYQDIEPNQHEWQYMIFELEDKIDSGKKGYSLAWAHFAEMAMNMKIMGSDDLNLILSAPELNFRDDLKLPERRKF